MVTRDYEQQIMEQIHLLDPDRQRQVLEFARSLARPRGIPGKLAVQYAREIAFPKEDLAEIAEAIEDCERIDWDEWDLPA